MATEFKQTTAISNQLRNQLEKTELPTSFSSESFSSESMPRGFRAYYNKYQKSFQLSYSWGKGRHEGGKWVPTSTDNDQWIRNFDWDEYGAYLNKYPDQKTNLIFCFHRNTLVELGLLD